MRSITRVMASLASSALPPVAPLKVPIPKNGVDYRNKIVLAPMVRSGELPTRLLALKYGADLVWGPETIDRALIGCTAAQNPHTSTLDFTRLPSNGAKKPIEDQKPSLIYRIHPSETSKLIYQIGTSSPELAVEAAKLVAPHVAGIDVNAGCPKPFSTLGGMGAALLRTPDKLCAILSALVEQVGKEFEIGISVKIRVLQPPEDTYDLVERLCQTGITGLTIHCRTPSMRPRERAVRDQLRNLAGICRKHGVAVLMNGDVESRSAAQSLVHEFDVDGAMIATAAEKNASVFLEEGPRPWREVTDAYFRFALETDNKWGNTKFMLNHLVHSKSPLKQSIPQAKCYTDVANLLELSDLFAKAVVVDERLGLTEVKPDSTNAKPEKSSRLQDIAAKKKRKRGSSHFPKSDQRFSKTAKVGASTTKQSVVSL